MQVYTVRRVIPATTLQRFGFDVNQQDVDKSMVIMELYDLLKMNNRGEFAMVGCVIFHMDEMVIRAYPNAVNDFQTFLAFTQFYNELIGRLSKRGYIGDTVTPYNRVERW